MEKKIYKVTKKAMRPASNKECCFYCQEVIGYYHKEDCVLIQKQVRIRMIIDYKIPAPAHWTKHDIEFNRNNSSWCCDNAVDELQELAEKEGCLCRYAKFECLDAEGKSFLDE